jgi:hypothetical protein
MKFCIYKFKKKILNRSYKRKGLVFHITGIICLIWFLVRVIPKPDRIRYPCQQTSLSIALGYIAFWGLLWSAIFHGMGFWSRQLKNKTAAIFPIVLVSFLVLFSVSSEVYANKYVNNEEKDIINIWTPIPKDPIGIPIGINPGRVVWVWDINATEEHLNGYWWQKENNNQIIIDQMFSNGLQELTGENNDQEAWNSVFRYFNQIHGYNDTSYQIGEKIAIKLNLNNCWSPYDLVNDYIEVDNERDASPYVVKSLLRQIINVVGVVESDITLYDASRPMANWFYNNVVDDFPLINYVDSQGGAHGRVKASPSNESVYFSDGSGLYRTLPKCVVEAKYLINMPILKRHPINQGVTLSGKNLFGTWIEPVVNVHNYHKSGLIVGNPTPQTDLLAHEHLGGKTILYIGDGLFATKIDHSTIDKFQMYPFNNDWTNSLFFSQDPVAIDSVMFDFLHTEGTNPCEGSQNYLHQSAEPILNFYDPENDGEYLSTGLGVHEHWDRNISIFSKNRYSGSSNNGIDFVVVYNERNRDYIDIINPESNYLYFMEKKVMSLKSTVIIGKINIELDVKAEDRIIDRVEVYINDILISSFENEPYICQWNKPSNGRFLLRAIVYFNDDNKSIDEMNIWKFL